MAKMPPSFLAHKKAMQAGKSPGTKAHKDKVAEVKAAAKAPKKK
jgi:hypothetical protein